MTTIRTIAAHDVVQHLHPRPVTERDELGLLVGSVVDATLARCSHEARLGRRPSTAALLRAAEAQFDEGVADADLPLGPEDRSVSLRQVAGVLKAFRSSPIFGLPRPRSRLILVNGEFGIYAQPDFWDGRSRFYEMKSYRPVPTPPDVATQLRLFQLAFPGFEAVLIGFARHEDPVGTSLERVAPLTEEDRRSILATAVAVARAKGVTSVLEYIDHPIVPYTLPGAGGGPGGP